MSRFSDYKYVSPVPIESIRKTICKLTINKDILDVGCLLSEGPEPIEIMH
jgi:hypothetical protein